MYALFSDSYLKVSYYLSYSAMTDYFSSSVLYPNTDCVCAECRMKQQEKQGSWTPQVLFAFFRMKE